MKAERLRKLLRQAAKDNFGEIASFEDFAKVRRLAKTIVEGLEDAEEFSLWVRELGDAEALEATGKARLIARGLRLCRQLFGSSAYPCLPQPSPSSGLRAPTHSLPGIGPKLAARLAERQLASVYDLIWNLPRRYQDVRNVSPLGEALESAVDGEHVTLTGVVKNSRFARRGARRWLDVRFADPGNSSEELTVRWFQAYPSLAAKFEQGTDSILSGVIRYRNGNPEMANPEVLSKEDEGVLVRYGAVPGVPAKTLAKAINAAAAHVEEMPDPLPEKFSAQMGLPTLAESLRVLHVPTPELGDDQLAAVCEFTSPFHRRLAFGELFALSVMVARQRRLAKKEKALPCQKENSEKFWSNALPFECTGAQKRSIEAISSDLTKSVPMSRLLQGDVGSGKTAVIFAAATQAVQSGVQVAIMAPTEILAEQHHRTLKNWFAASEYRVGYLSGSLPRAVKTSTLGLLAAGKIQVLVGTHALLSEDVGFEKLGLVVIDEQHRFGVEQRGRLRAKGSNGHMPHLLVTTATPIPRSLALTAFGDLDVSVLDELPPGRKPIETSIAYGDEGRKQAFEMLQETLGRGERVYIVCPLVEPSEESQTRADAVSVHQKLGDVLPEARPVLVHGRLSTEERLEAFAKFKKGESKVMVATTVIEVGVDVPEATLMIIRDADRFGLAQLHQLRGRVGRGEGDSRCVLLCRGGETSVGGERLDIMASTNDGFVIADKDLQIRGPGELLGAAQSGVPRLRFGNIAMQTELLLAAREAAQEILVEDPELKTYPDLAATVLHLERRREVAGTEGG